MLELLILIPNLLIEGIHLLFNLSVGLVYLLFKLGEAQSIISTVSVPFLLITGLIYHAYKSLFIRKN
jgi:hypothetical protein